MPALRQVILGVDEVDIGEQLLALPWKLPCRDGAPATTWPGMLATYGKAPHQNANRVEQSGIEKRRIEEGRLD